MKAFVRLCGVLVFMTLTSAAEQRGDSGAVLDSGLRLLGIQSRTGQVNVMVRTKKHRSAPSATLSTVHQAAGIAPAKPAAFRSIAPISAMGPLFPEDDLLRGSWTNFGFHRTAALRPVRVAAATSRAMLEPRKVIPSAPLGSPPDAQGPTPLGHVSSDGGTNWTYRQEAQRPEDSFTGREKPSGISPERARQIQSALIAQGYLSGAATGAWDTASVAAMRRLQADHGWQTKLAPDARALIFLGLGPGTATP